MNRERHAVASTPSSSPARPRKASSSDFDFHPGRVCIKVDATKDDAEDYVAFIESATITNSDTAASTVLVAGRAHNSSYTDEAYAGAWFNDAHIGADLTDDYVDYLTFFIDPELRPAEGATASLSLAITIAYHHVATGRRVLAERTSMPITMDAAGEDETVLDIGTTTPEHCASGDSSVDATLTFAGLAIDQWAPEPVLLAIKDAAGTVSEDQVRVNSVAREDDGAAVGVEISGVDEAGAEDIVDALVLDVSSADAASFRETSPSTDGAAMYAIETRPNRAGGSFYFRLLMNGVSPEAVDGISIAYIDTRATPSQLVEVSIEAAVVLDNVDAAAFNTDEAAQTQFKKAIVRTGAH